MKKKKAVKAGPLPPDTLMIDKKIPVRCRYTALLPISKVKPNPANPNHHPPEQIELLQKLIQGSGWRKPLVISNLSGLLVSGHGRLLAAKKLKLSVVPVEYQDYDTPAQEDADLTADNFTAQMSQMDDAAVLDILRDIQKSEPHFNLDLLAVPETILAALEDTAFLPQTPAEADEPKEPKEKLPQADGEHVVFKATFPTKKHAIFMGSLNQLRKQHKKHTVVDGLVLMAQLAVATMKRKKK